MSNLIQDKILALAPAATVKEGEVLTVTVPAENFHAVAEMLRDDHETQFDFLVCMTGNIRFCPVYATCGIRPT